MTASLTTTYDEVPYESLPFTQTHPDRLAVIGRLLGLRPAPSERCRVLELGCAAGGNLIPLAYALPESQFLGVDLSRVQVAEGQELIASLGLKNVELRHLSILDVGPDLGFSPSPQPPPPRGEGGKWDYIICHGVYSWVPPPLSRKNSTNL